MKEIYMNMPKRKGDSVMMYFKKFDIKITKHKMKYSTIVYGKNEGLTVRNWWRFMPTKPELKIKLYITYLSSIL